MGRPSWVHGSGLLLILLSGAATHSEDGQASLDSARARAPWETEVEAILGRGNIGEELSLSDSATAADATMTQSKMLQTQEHREKALETYNAHVDDEKLVKSEHTSKDETYESHIKSINAVLIKARAAAETAEVEHKEATQVHTRFIANELYVKEKQEKDKEKAKKAEINMVTLELNEKAEHNKAVVSVDAGGSMSTFGSFKMMSVQISYDQNEAANKLKVSETSEVQSKSVALVSERKVKVDEAKALVANSVIAERDRKTQADTSEASADLVALRQQEVDSKEAIGKSIHQQFSSEAGELSTKVNTSNFMLSLIQVDEHTDNTISDSTTNTTNTTITTITTNTTAEEREAEEKAEAREKGAKDAVLEIERARTEADQQVEEAESKESVAKISVKNAKEAVLKQEANKAREALEAELNQLNGVAETQYNKTFGLPAKPWTNLDTLTEPELETMLFKARTKTKTLCDEAMNTPDVISKAKSVADAAYVAAIPSEVKKVAETENMTEEEEKAYQTQKNEAYTTEKNAFDTAFQLSLTADDECKKAKVDSDDLASRVEEARKSGFVQVNLPAAAFQFKTSEMENYPDCARLLGRTDFLKWILLTDKGLEMSKKEQSCRLHKVHAAAAKVVGLTEAVAAAKEAMETIKGANTCVLQPAISRMFSMLNNEEVYELSPELKAFVTAVEEQKQPDDATSATAVPTPTPASCSGEGTPATAAVEATCGNGNDASSPPQPCAVNAANTACVVGTGSCVFVQATPAVAAVPCALNEAAAAVNPTCGSGNDDADPPQPCAVRDDGTGCVVSTGTCAFVAGVDATAANTHCQSSATTCTYTPAGSEVTVLPAYEILLQSGESNGARLPPLADIDLGAALESFEKESTSPNFAAHVQQSLDEQKENEAMLANQTREAKAQQNAAGLRAKAAEERIKQTLSSTPTGEDSPQQKYSCLYEQYQNAVNPPPTADQAVANLEAVVDGQSETSDAGTPELGERKGRAPNEVPSRKRERKIPFVATTFDFAAPFRKLSNSVRDLGESSDTDSGPSCSQFYHTNTAAASTSGSAEDADETPASGTGGRRLLQSEDPATTAGEPAADSTDLRMKISTFVSQMAVRSQSKAFSQLTRLEQELFDAKQIVEEAKASVENAVSMISAEEQRHGTEAALAAGECTGSLCRMGVTLDDTEEGDPIVWTCRRGMTTKDTRFSFTCSVEVHVGTSDAAMRMCSGKEIYYDAGIKYVGFLKELTCPTDVSKSCTEKRQCGSELLPLTKAFTQARLRNDCAQL